MASICSAGRGVLKCGKPWTFVEDLSEVWVSTMFGRSISVSVAAVLLLSVASCGSESKSTEPSDAPAGTESAAATTDVVDPTTTSAEPQDTVVTSPAATEPTESTSAASSTTVAPSTTVDDRPVNTVDQTLALAATLHADDFPAGWTAFTPAEAFRTSPESCAYRVDGAVTKVSNGGGQGGPNMQLGETGAFAGSFALVFPDESLAIDYIDVVNTEDWSTCRAGQIQQGQVNAGSDNLVAVVTR